MPYQKRLTILMLTLSLAALALSCGLIEMLRPGPTEAPVETATATPTRATTPSLAPTETPGIATETPTATLSPTPEPVEPSDTPEPTDTQPPQAPTSTHTPSPTPSQTLTPEPTETLPGLRIEFFDVEMEVTAEGRTIRCAWDTSGANGVRVVLGTSHRFPPWHEGPADGSTTFEVSTTLYDRPDVTLTAFGESGGEAIDSVTLDWYCANAYFFVGRGVETPRICPAGPHAMRQGAQQAFQGGAMIWVPDIEGQDVIFVLYNSGSWNLYKDTWDESQPESDPSVVPPAGLYQPIRGFGKVWRQQLEVQNGLNWAAAGERSVTVTYQRQAQESIGGVRYIQVAGGELMRLTGLGGSGSTWTTLP